MPSSSSTGFPFHPHGPSDSVVIFWMCLVILICIVDYFTGFCFGLACRPTDSYIARFVLFFAFPGDANPGWGDWCRSRGGWGGFVVFGFEQFLSQCGLLRDWA